MKIPDETQTISTRAIALLAGQQHARIDVQWAGQDGARLSIVWGTLLLTLSAADQVNALAVGPGPRPGHQHLLSPTSFCNPSTDRRGFANTDRTNTG